MKTHFLQKFLVLIMAVILFNIGAANAQIQKGNVMVGGDIANFNLNLNKGGNFSMTIDPKAAWFIQDNWALGAYLNLSLVTAKGAGSSVDYGVGALSRYYFSPGQIDVNLIRHTRFFVEGNVGIEGHNPSVGTNTNGLGLGIGPGIAYFITPNIGLEGLLKYNAIIGFGSSATSNYLNLQVGFQIYLPHKKIQNTIENPGQ